MEQILLNAELEQWQNQFSSSSFGELAHVEERLLISVIRSWANLDWTES